MVSFPFLFAAVVVPVGAFKFSRHRLETKAAKSVPETGAGKSSDGVGVTEQKSVNVPGGLKGMFGIREDENWSTMLTKTDRSGRKQYISFRAVRDNFRAARGLGPGETWSTPYTKYDRNGDIQFHDNKPWHIRGLTEFVDFLTE